MARQTVVQLDDAGTVGRISRRGHGVLGGNLGLQLIRAGTPEPASVLQEVEPDADRARVPSRAILIPK